MHRTAGLILLVGGLVLVNAAIAFSDARAYGAALSASVPPLAVLVSSLPPADEPSPTAITTPSATPTPALAVTPAPLPTPAPAPVHPDWAPLAVAINALLAGSDAQVSVQVIELGWTAPASWAQNPSQTVGAASDYKLVALMAEAKAIAEGRLDRNGMVCFEEGDFEAGWYDDYTVDACFTRTELARRAGMVSDNTAGHMLVRDIGGSDALNAFARQYGATGSNLFDGNTTTAHDLAALWAAEASGRLGGAAAEAWLYPVLTRTRYEAGIPAGLPNSMVAIHKTGELDGEVNDAALVTGGGHGAYVLVVMTDGAGGDEGWHLIASISAAVQEYEAKR